MNTIPPSRPSFSEMGLPDGHAFPELDYHPSTNTLIALSRPRDSVLPSRRLSIRHGTESRYRPIGTFSPSISVDGFAVSATLPVLYFLTYEWREHPNGPVGGYWDALYRFSLESEESRLVARRGGLILPDGYQSAWLQSLFSITADERTIYCKVGLQGVGQVDHCLARLTLPDLTIVPITKLEAVFV